MAGIFISFEGTEGCGKSTQIERLAARLESIGHKVTVTREPGGTLLGEAIRDILKHEDSGKGMCAEAELLLFAASRAQLTRELIKPALAEDQIVLCDRFLDSTTVYQGVARKLDDDSVRRVNRFAVGDALPEVTFLIDIPAATGLERARARAGKEFDRMEQESLPFFEAVRDGYLELAKKERRRFHVVDGLQSIEVIEEVIWNEFNRRFA